MHSTNELFFDTFLEMPPTAAIKVARQQPHPLARTLLVSIGDAAGRICQRTLALAADWLGAAPPVAHWSGSTTVDAAPDAEDAALLAALDAIARRQVADDLRSAGYALQTTEALAVWIVADAAGELPDPARIAAAAANARRLAWNRIRAETAIRVLAVSEPAEGAALAAWQQQLAASTKAIYWSSPVNLHHLRVDAPEHAERTAVALAVLLCGNFPSHAQPRHDAGLAVGAAAWTAPRAAVRRGLALHSALHTVACVEAQLVRPADAAADELAALAGRIPSLEQSDGDLAGSIPPALAATRWRDFGVSWEDLDDLRQLLHARMARREERHAQSVRVARCAWLDARMDAWHALLDDVDRLQAASGAGAPPLGAYRAALTALHTRLRRDLDALTTALERSDPRVCAADEQVELAWGQVEKVCGQLPRPTPRGLVYAALQPWMWPIWPYAFHTLLPQEGQRLLDAIAHAGKARWHEANWHMLRQAALAMSQDVQRRLHTLDQLSNTLAALRAYLTAALAALPLPAPWTPATLHRVWMTARGQAPALAAFPTHLRPLDWCTAAPDASGEQLIAHFAGAAEFVERWTVLDCLAQPFLEHGAAGAAPVLSVDAPAVADGLPPACMAWLTDFVETALPLWPDPAVTPNMGTVGWCLLPPPAPGGTDSGYGPDTLRHWCEDVVNLAPAALAGQTLAILRWAPVAVGEEACAGSQS